MVVHRESGQLEARNTHRGLLVGVAIPFEEKLSKIAHGLSGVSVTSLRFRRNDGQECNMIQGFAEGYKTSCKQKYIYRELAAVGSSGNIVKDQFRFPSSCCCHVKFIGDPTVRLGLGLDLRSFNQTTATVSKTRWRQ